ncbi:hypothetical protein NX722_24215 [Endozoicomonas gorgoniicola]|uniref:Uncharacterized protein n=1 Tax=Endozoicomonas gorgoniicola TaxID=1234144 RepID=A0ABT3N221_9GAMM|nr:hypothetical protein [Endozoicomonas gorgoniicola]MCW7555675.1 hypothetical protein [Endozoicomonas gorgoniicola]
MSVEARLEKLETQHKQLDANQHSLAKVCADIKTIALTNQHDIAGLKVDVAGVKSDLAALTQATLAGFKRNDEQHEETRQEIAELNRRFDQLELLIRQSLPSN